MIKPKPAHKRTHVSLMLPESDMVKLRRVQKIMARDDEYDGQIGQQSAIRYALDKVAGEATGG